MPVGTEVGLGQDDIVLDGQMTDGRAIAYSEREREFTFAEKGHGSTHFLTMSIVAKWLDEPRYATWSIWRLASIQATLC